MRVIDAQRVTLIRLGNVATVELVEADGNVTRYSLSDCDVAIDAEPNGETVVTIVGKTAATITENETEVTT